MSYLNIIGSKCFYCKGPATLSMPPLLYASNDASDGASFQFIICEICNKLNDAESKFIDTDTYARKMIKES